MMPGRKETAEHSIACGMKGNIINNVIVDNYNHVWIVTNQAVREYNQRMALIEVTVPVLLIFY